MDNRIGIVEYNVNDGKRFACTLACIKINMVIVVIVIYETLRKTL